MLARIALRSLGRFVTSMHKSFPAASATIFRRQATIPEDDVLDGKDVSTRHDSIVGWFEYTPLCRCCELW